MEHWQSFLALVNMIMFCTGIPGHYPVNETTSSLTLTFWYTLQVSGHHGAACPDPVLQAGPEAPVHGDWGLAWLRLVPRDFRCPPLLALHLQPPQGTYLRNAGPMACFFHPQSSLEV